MSAVTEAPLVSAQTNNLKTVGLGELKHGRNPEGSLISYSLGSCVGITAYDRASSLGMMAHVVLPRSSGRCDGPPARYADMAVRNILAELLGQGARLNRVVVKVVGGAKILSLGSLPGMDIGSQNVSAVLEELKAQGITPSAQDTGGNYGRTIELRLSDGSLKITSVGRPVLII